MWWCDSLRDVYVELVGKDLSEIDVWSDNLKNEKKPILEELRKYLIKKCFGFIIDVKVDTVLVVISSTEIIFSWVPTRKLYYKLLKHEKYRISLKWQLSYMGSVLFYHYVARFHMQIAKIFWLNFICSKGSEWITSNASYTFNIYDFTILWNLNIYNFIM